MTASIDLSGLKRSRWYEYAIRFLFGGLITIATGLIARRYGPGIGGLFLAFPAIFPATATLVEKHETEKKRSAGLNGVIRGRRAAGLDAEGAALGSLGLMGFGAVVWLLLPSYGAGIVLSAAAVTWLIVSGVGWMIRKGYLI
jgi:hypothetical protein